MNEHDDHLILWVKIWVEVVSGVIIIISVAGLFSMMRLGGWLGFAGGISWVSYRFISAGDSKRIVLSWQDWPFYVLAGLSLVSICIRPHSFIDSYSYRLPQILLWLQEGHPWAVANVDFRINQIPHIWSFLSITFFLPFGERAIAIPNLISYLVLLGVLKKFADASNILKIKSRWIILIFMSSPVIVMQTASNDNVLTSLTFLIIAAYFLLLHPPSTSSVSYSALAFALCCGIKPQYIMLIPLWVAWFFYNNNTSIRQFRWKMFVWLIPLIIICSPLPTFSINYLYHGSIIYPKVFSSTIDDKPAINVNFSDKEEVTTVVPKSWINERKGFPYDNAVGIRGKSILPSISNLAFALFALPVNPMAGQMTTWINRMSEKITFFRQLNWHQLRIYPILITEQASLSIFATMALLIGMFRKKKRRRSFKWLAFGSLISMTVAIGLTTPGAAGRSFIGYLILTFPMAFAGLASVKKQVLMTWGGVCFATGLMMIVINPACPLWPADYILNRLPTSKIYADIKRYPQYSRRIESGRALVSAVPEDKKVIGAILNDAEPSVELWKPYALNRKVQFYSPQVAAAELEQDSISYIVVKHKDLILNGEVSSYFLNRLSAEVIMKKKFTSYMQRGPESWFLLKVKKK